MSDEWYYAQDGVTQGPMSLAELRLLVESGRARRDGHVWSDGLGDWQPISSLGLFPSKRPAAAPVVPPAPASAQATAVSRTKPSPHAKPSTASQPLAEPPIATPSREPQSANVLPAAPTASARAASVPSKHRDRTSLSPLAITVIVVGMLMSGAIGWLLRAAMEPPRSAPSDMQVARRSDSPPSNNAPSTVFPAPAPVATQPVQPLPSSPILPVTPPANVAPSNPPPVIVPPSNTPPSVSPAAPTTTTAPPAITEPLLNPLNEPPAPAAAPTGTSTASVAPAANAQVLFQELDFERQPRFEILGNEIAQELKYQILSQLAIDPPDQEGARKVQQTVVETRLERSDDLSRATFVDALRELKGSRFRYQVTARGEILGLTAIDKGGQQATNVASPANGQGFLVSSVMDKDAWKQVAEWTFFTPRVFTQGTRDVTRRVLHDFGPLGSWYGDTHFQPGVLRGGYPQIGFVHQLEYQPPQPGRGGALPFTIKKAQLKPETAGGVLNYNTSLERVESAQERFTVRGEVQAEALMQELPVTLSESQLLTMRITDRAPTGR